MDERLSALKNQLYADNGALTNVTQTTASELTTQIKSTVNDVIKITENVGVEIQNKLKSETSENQKLLETYQKRITNIIESFAQEVGEIKTKEDVQKFQARAAQIAEEIVNVSKETINNLNRDELFDELKRIVEDGTQRIFDKVLSGITLFQAKILSKMIPQGESSKTT